MTGQSIDCSPCITYSDDFCLILQANQSTAYLTEADCQSVPCLPRWRSRLFHTVPPSFMVSWLQGWWGQSDEFAWTWPKCSRTYAPLLPSKRARCWQKPNSWSFTSWYNVCNRAHAEHHSLPDSESPPRKFIHHPWDGLPLALALWVWCIQSYNPNQLTKGCSVGRCVMTISFKLLLITLHIRSLVRNSSVSFTFIALLHIVLSALMRASSQCTAASGSQYITTPSHRDLVANIIHPEFCRAWAWILSRVATTQAS